MLLSVDQERLRRSLWALFVLEIKQQGSLHKASLITNRKAAQEIFVALLPNGYINFDMIPEGYREEIIRQIDGEVVAREFFDTFFFRFDCAGLEDYEILYIPHS